MSERSHSIGRTGRFLGGVVLGALWVGIGIGVGWAVGFLADRLVLPERHTLVLATLGLCAAVLCGWAYGSRLLYLEIRAGVDEATSAAPTRARTGYRYVAIAAAPIVGVLIGLSSSSISGHGAPRSAPPAATTKAPAHVIASAKKSTDKKSSEAVHPSAASSTYVVRPGDALTSIAERFYGSAADWPLIARANAGKLDEKTGARLVDPTLLPVGIELTIPRADATTTITTTPSAAVTDRSVSPSREREVFAVLAGFGLIGTALFARRQLARRSYQQMRAAVGARPPRLEEPDAEIEAQLRPVSVAELPEWIDATNRLLCASLLADRSIVPPKVSVVRAGSLGVEVLLEEKAERAPEGFLLLDGGRTLRLDPRLELAEIHARTPRDTQPFLAGLVPIAEDETGSYLVACGPGESLSVRGSDSEITRGLGAIAAHLANAPWGEVTFYRLGPARFVGSENLQELDLAQLAVLDQETEPDPLWRVGLPEHQPIVLVEDPELAEAARTAAPAIVSVIGPIGEANRLVYFEDESVVIEPLGLRLPALLPSEAELAALARLTAAASAVPTRPLEDLSVLPSPEAELPVAGPVEVRILRSVPDIVGDIDPEKVHLDVVQLVAFLALHGRRATTSKLRDVFGVYRPDASRQDRTVWNATSRARAALGTARFPVARGSAAYTISAEVSCDWLRFKEIVSVARALELNGEVKRAIEVLTVALELVGDGVPCSDDSVVGRYVWLDAEQHLVEMESLIVQAAHSMAMLSIEHRPYPKSLDDAAWAIERGRVISPDARALREAAMFLAEAREDADAVAAEFSAAVDAVDALELGEDIDPVVETLFQALTRSQRSTPPGDAAVAL